MSAGAGRAFLARKNVDAQLAAILRAEFGCEVKVRFVEPENMSEILAKIREDRVREEERSAALQQDRVRHEEKKAQARADGAAFGKVISDNPIPMDELTEATGRCVLTGEVLSVNVVDSKKGNTKIVTFAFSDYSDSVAGKLFLTERGEGTVAEKAERLLAVLKEGAWILARGRRYRYDDFSHEMVLMTTDIMAAPRPSARTTRRRKRVELHLHTQISSMDACIPPVEAIARAAKWGHKAVAITDHGVLQSFPGRLWRGEKVRYQVHSRLRGVFDRG